MQVFLAHVFVQSGKKNSVFITLMTYFRYHFIIGENKYNQVKHLDFIKKK